jgi:hypothetical protein
MEYKFEGNKDPFILIKLSINFTPEQYNNLFVIIRKYKMTVEDISRIPFISATQFSKCSGDDSDYVFIIKTNEILESTTLDEWKKVFISLGEGSDDGENDSRFMISCSHIYELIRIKKILLPFL